MTPIYAQRAGFYRKYGLTVDFQMINSGAAVSAAIIGGALQIGGSSLMGLVQAHTKGIKFQMVTPAAIYISGKPSDVMMVRTDSPYRTAADLNGKTFASPALHDLLSTTSMAWIDQNGGDSKSMHQVELPPSAMPAALDAGRVDVAAMSEPRVAVALRAGNLRILGKPYDVIAPTFLISAFFGLPDVIEANRDAIERLARAHHDANDFANAHPDQTLPWLVETAKIDTSFSGGRATFTDTLRARDIQPVIEAAVRFKVIDRSFDANELISPVVANLRFS